MEQLQKNGAKHCFETVTRRHRCRSTVSTWRPMAWRQPSCRRRCSTARPTSTATAMASYRRCVGERFRTGGSARMSANGLVPHRLTALGIALPSPLFPPLFLPTQLQRVTLHVLVDSPRVSPWPGMPLHELYGHPLTCKTAEKYCFGSTPWFFKSCCILVPDRDLPKENCDFVRQSSKLVISFHLILIYVFLLLVVPTVQDVLLTRNFNAEFND